MHTFFFTFLILAIQLVASAPTSAPSVCTVTIFSESDFHGQSEKVDIWENCRKNFAYGTIKSLIQEQGIRCRHFREINCEAGNHSPALTLDSYQGAYEFGNMGDWTGVILSFKCTSAVRSESNAGVGSLRERTRPNEKDIRLSAEQGMFVVYASTDDTPSEPTISTLQLIDHQTTRNGDELCSAIQDIRSINGQ
ncbi:hypothetical protein CC80DRAFT_556748 [Byssothecium circinans]|uniref:Ecp2 effector protein domain-containing protein n=1 Tax=Byssothecium circinans TaxID=147558 RepID=A0A6A5UJZ0_9PLEO|nr:hypothetical protein CC80DRAFT_556748 [Byssothecium circinans]